MTNPKVRFKQKNGYDYPPVQPSPLYEYLEVNTDRNKAHIYDQNDVLSVSGDYGVVNQIEFQGRSFAGADVGDYHVLYNGDIVYTKSPLKENPYGIIKFNKGPTGIVSTLYAVYHCKNNADGRFVEYYFDLKFRLNNYLKPLVNIGAKHDMKISAEKAIDGLVAFPCFEEQQKIADFLSSVDDVIAASEAEVQNLETQKKVVMKKIFSREVRFKREDGTGFPEWEMTILDNSCEYRRGSFPQPYGLEEWYDELNGMPFIQVADVNDNMSVNSDTKRHISDLAKPMSVFIPKGTLIITLQGTIGRVAITDYDAYIDRTLLLFQRISEKIVLEYFKYALYMCFDEEKKKADGGIIKTITKETLGSFVIPLPCLEEQRLIADFLYEIDEAISKAKNELELWRKLKKGLLQQMFVA